MNKQDNTELIRAINTEAFFRALFPFILITGAATVCGLIAGQGTINRGTLELAGAVGFIVAAIWYNINCDAGYKQHGLTSGNNWQDCKDGFRKLREEGRR